MLQDFFGGDDNAGIDLAMGHLLDALAPFAERLAPDSEEASLIRVARRDFEKALKVPPDHVARATALGIPGNNCAVRTD